MLFVLAYLAVFLFGLAVVVRLIQYRTRDRRPTEEVTAADRSVLWIASQALLGGVFGFLLITVMSMAVFGVYQQEIGRPFSGLESLLVALVLAVTLVPAATVVGFRALGITPASLATLGAWGLSGVGLMAAGEEVGNGGVESAWNYGLIAAIAYALATVGTVAIPSMVGRPDPTDRQVSPPPGS